MDFYYDLGTYSCPVTTGSAKAQLWFDRGLIWTYGYNHQEAATCFRRALAEDPGCAMAHWGLAYASGPNYNMPWELHDPATRAEALATAYDATQSALAHAKGCTPAECALINALTARYPQRTPVDDMHAWDHDFANSMRAAFAEVPDNLDLRCVYVESLLNLTPWKMWDLKTGLPAEGAATKEAQQVLEDAFDSLPGAMTHPGLLHLYVHLMEMSPTPEKALKAGDVLRDLVPDAGHLVHMPTHIDVLCGNYQDVVYCNQKAIHADLKYSEPEGPYNIYTVYRQHEYHFVFYGPIFLRHTQPPPLATPGPWEHTPLEITRIERHPMQDYSQ